MLRKICNQLGISESNIAFLESLSSNLQHIADLVVADIFIDCFKDDGSRCVVAAQAKPSNKLSLYNNYIIGEEVLLENEPAVFAARETKNPIRDLSAKTQENRIVKQNIVPIINPYDDVIGVLICEYDVSESALQDKKYKKLEETVEHLRELLFKYKGIATPYNAAANKDIVQQKEIHHRVKNNLQMVASILNIQARKANSPELAIVLKENVNRILSIAAIHDLLTYKNDFEKLSVKRIIEEVMKNISLYSVDFNKNIVINVFGEDIYISSDKGVSIAIVINELLINSLKHAFINKTEGKIDINIGRGNLYSHITVIDDGVGFETNTLKGHSFGMDLVKLTVADKLKGKLQIHSGETGTRITFDFEN